MDQEMKDSVEMKIKINAITGTAAEIEVKDNDSVQQLKEKICNSLHISPELQRITFKDKVLENGLLMDYGIKDGSSLTLTLVMKTGTAAASKRSLNIDQKSVSEIIRSLPQEQLQALLSQKKPVTITAKIGDHVVVFTLVPSDCQDSSQEKEKEKESSPNSHHHHHHHHHHNHHNHHQNNSQNSRLRSHQQLISEEPAPTNLADKVDLIRKKLSYIRKLEEINRIEQVNEGRIKKQKKIQGRLFRRSKLSWKKNIIPTKEKNTQDETKEQKEKKDQKHQHDKTEKEAVCDSHSNQLVVQDSITLDKDVLISEPSTPLRDVISSTDVLFTSSSGNLVSCLKCTKCTKKLKPTQSFTCRCGQVFCINHRHQNLNISSEKGHNCSFDFKTHGKEELRASNPLIQGPKIQHI